MLGYLWAVSMDGRHEYQMAELLFSVLPLHLFHSTYLPTKGENNIKAS